MNSLIRPRRLFVSGGSRLSPNAALLWQELGRRLARKGGPVVLTGGLAGRISTPEDKPADLAIVEGMLQGLKIDGIAPEERIETFLPDKDKDWNELKRFREGRVITLEHRNAQSRRFSMVYSADVVISIEGEKGTHSVLDVALAIDRPILPLPFAGGASADAWRDHPQEVKTWFQLSDDEVARFTATRLAELDKLAISALADEVHSCLMRGFARTCFVIMPFNSGHDPVYEKAIQPALEARGLSPIRTDKHVLTGNVIAAIRDGLRHCFFAIADTTGDRPNVMYELGMAHAGNKPVILLRRAIDDGAMDAPFDLQTESNDQILR